MKKLERTLLLSFLFIFNIQLYAARGCFDKSENNLLWYEVMRARKPEYRAPDGTISGGGSSSFTADNETSETSGTSETSASSSTLGDSDLTTLEGTDREFADGSTYSCKVFFDDDGNCIYELVVDSEAYQLNLGNIIMDGEYDASQPFPLNDGSTVDCQSYQAFANQWTSDGQSAKQGEMKVNPNGELEMICFSYNDDTNTIQIFGDIDSVQPIVSPNADPYCWYNITREEALEAIGFTRSDQ